MILESAAMLSYKEGQQECTKEVISNLNTQLFKALYIMYPRKDTLSCKIHGQIKTTVTSN